MIAKYTTPCILSGEKELDKAAKKVFGKGIFSMIPTTFHVQDWFIKETARDKICACSAYADRYIYKSTIICLISDRHSAVSWNIGLPFTEDEKKAAKKGFAHCRNILKKMNVMDDYVSMHKFLDKTASELGSKDWSE